MTVPLPEPALVDLPLADPQPALPTQSLGRSTTTGFLWLALQSLSGRASVFISQLILARMLLPSAFGQIGLAYTVVSIVWALVTFGVDEILLQRLKRMHYWVRPAFWTSLGLGIAGAAIMMAAAPIAAKVYHNPAIIGLIVVLATSLPLGALSTVPAVKLRASLNFRFLATYTSFETGAIAAASVALAALGFGAFSFVAPLPIAAIVKALVYWRREPARLNRRFRKRQVTYILGNGIFVLATRLVIEAVNQGDYIVLGLMATQNVVGAYYFAFRLAAQPVRMLAGNFHSVLFPAFTHLQGEPERQEAAAIRAARLLAYTVTPVSFLQAAGAAPLLHLMFGARWDSAIPLVQILSLGLPGDAVAWIAGALLIARREFKRELFFLCAFALPFFLSVYGGARFGSSLGVATAVALCFAVLKPVNVWRVLHKAMTLRIFLGIFVAPVVFSAVSMGGIAALFLAGPLVGKPLFQLIILGALGPAIYVAMVRFLTPKIFLEISDRLNVGRVLARIPGLRGRFVTKASEA